MWREKRPPSKGQCKKGRKSYLFSSDQKEKEWSANQNFSIDAEGGRHPAYSYCKHERENRGWKKKEGGETRPIS